MPHPDFPWPIHAPLEEGLGVAREIGLTEGEDFILDGDAFCFRTTGEAMSFNRALASKPETGRSAPEA